MSVLIGFARSMKDPFLCTVLTEIGEGAQQKAASRCEIVCG